MLTSLIRQNTFIININFSVNPLHVAVLCSYFNFKAGGLERHVYYLIQGLTNYGIKVSLITSYKDPYTNVIIPPYRSNKLNVIPLKYILSPFNNPLMPRLSKILTEIDPDIIHVHDHYFYGSMFSSILRKFIKRPLVLTVHTSKLRYDNSLKNLIVDVYDAVIGNAVLKVVDKIIVLTRTTMYELIKRGVPLDKIVYIPNFLTIGSIEDYDMNIYNSIKESGKLKILYVGRLVPRKGPHILLNAFNIALKNVFIPKDSILMIVGKGPLEEHLRIIASTSSELKEKVIFWGAVSDKVLGAIYKAADVVVLPSLSGEVAPFVIQEAIFFEKPFVASLVGGILDYVMDHFWGFYVPPKDMIILARTLGSVYKLLTKNPNFVLEKVRENKRKLLCTHSKEHIIFKTIITYVDAAKFI
ncbi:MAG: glycosyltransferase family 4 protein [Nitrososphaeria archaeon]